MRLLSNLHVKGKAAVLPHRAIRRQSHYFIYRPRIVQTGDASNHVGQQVVTDTEEESWDF